jgi:hypothetical protein
MEKGRCLWGNTLSRSEGSPAGLLDQNDLQHREEEKSPSGAFRAFMGLKRISQIGEFLQKFSSPSRFFKPFGQPQSLYPYQAITVIINTECAAPVQVSICTGYGTV